MASSTRRRKQFMWLPLMGVLLLSAPVPAIAAADEDLEVEITKKGLGKEVVIKQGPKEWFMLVEVTPENTVVLRQEKVNETYLVDESETHDRAMSSSEVDTAIADYVNSVKARVNRRK